MYGARDYPAHLGYGAMPLFQDETIRGHSKFWLPRKNLPVPYCHKYCTVPYEAEKRIRPAVFLTGPVSDYVF